VKDERSRVFRSGDRKGGNKDERRESEGGIEIANPKISEGYTEVFRVSKLLQVICKRLCQDSKAIT